MWLRGLREIVLAPAMLALSFAQGWLVLPLAAAIAASVFGQVTVNETMTARYISPQLRARIYSVRFFVGFLGAAASAPLIAVLHERTGSLTLVTLVLAGFSVVTLACALLFPDRQEELHPELWANAAPRAATPGIAATSGRVVPGTGAPPGTGATAVPVAAE